MFKFSLNWLRDYFEEKIKYDEIMNKLKLQGFEFGGKKEIDGDIITEIEVKANRPDMLYHMGIARELKAFDGEKIPEITHEKCTVNSEDFPVKISVNKEVCKRYCALKISGVDLKKTTPEYITKRLNALGINSVNAVVDIGNYVMLDMGQPIHAYDFNKIAGKKLFIDKSEKDSKVTTFIGEEAEVKKGDIVIFDSESIKCVAGIIGAQGAAVTESTKDIILEAAVFDEIPVRLTSRRLKISTPSSFRFERGVNIDSTCDVLLKCAEMITKICGGKIETNVFDFYPEKKEEESICLSAKKASDLIGEEICQGLMMKLLEKYDFKCTAQDSDTIKVKIPSYRLDVKLEVDLIEEVARIYGYDNIKPELPTIKTSYTKNKVWDNMDIIREVFTGLGFNETINYSFIPNNTMNVFGIENGDRLYSDLVLQNPIAGAYSLMRPMMTYSLLSSLAYNYSVNNNNLALFELGRVYFKDKSFDTGVKETDTLGFIMSGVRIPKGFGQDKDIKYSYYDLLSYLNVIMNRFGQNFELRQNDYKFCEEGSGYDIILSGKVVGFIGELNKSKLSSIQNVKLIKDQIFYGEFYLDSLTEKIKKIKFESKYPSINRLYNLLQRKDVPAGEIIGVIKSSSEIIRNVAVKDIYFDKTFKENEYAVLYEVKYCSKDSTLTAEQIEDIENSFLKKLNEKWGISFKK
ncbi:MAG: phenylalanine--tRNA ligase subunit beta [Clostridia bacterium]|nr:phenylalanine--tRNA ligase subunit beta [Clostridia bacterium]